MKIMHVKHYGNDIQQVPAVKLENGDDLQKLTYKNLKEGVAHFFYLKKNGTTREAFGTLNGDLIPAEALGGGNNTNDGVQRYYDFEAKAWRTYTIENLIALL